MTDPIMSQGEGTVEILEALRREQSNVPLLMMLMIFSPMLTSILVLAGIGLSFLPVAAVFWI